MTFHLRPAAAARTFAAFALLASANAGCSDRSFTWVGPVSGTDAVAAVKLDDGQVRAYVCGGSTTYPTLTRWFDGEVQGDNTFQTTSAGWTIQGYLGDSFVESTLWSPSQDYFYVQGAPVDDDDLAGLYAVEDSGCGTGVIVWNDPSGEPSLQGVWCDSVGNFAQVTPVYPIRLTARGILVQVDLGFLGPGYGVRELYVTPVVAR